MSEYNPNDIMNMIARNASLGNEPSTSSSASPYCFAYQKGTCKRGDDCKFEHVHTALSVSSRGVDNSSSFPDKKVFIPGEKLKKPKHLKRKLEAALQTNNANELMRLAKEKAELEEVKRKAAKNFKKTCRKVVIRMYGEEAWVEETYADYIASGIVGNALLAKLGISTEQQKLFGENKKEGMLSKKRLLVASMNIDTVTMQSCSKQTKTEMIVHEDVEAPLGLRKIPTDKKSVKKLVNKLFGEDKWKSSLECMYDDLVANGLTGHVLLKKLGITDSILKSYK